MDGPAEFIESQGWIPNLNVKFHDEIGVAKNIQGNICPADTYEQTRLGLRQMNTVSVMASENTNGDFRQPMKGSVFNEFPRFLSPPLSVTQRPTLVLQIGIYFGLLLFKWKFYNTVFTLQNLRPH